MNLEKFPEKKDQQHTVVVKTPEYFPRKQITENTRENIKIVSYAKVIKCETKDGVTRCFSASAR